MPALLTKSRYLNGLQCPAYLWKVIHEPQKIPKIDESTQYRFDEGYRVGDLAKTLFPKGVDLSSQDFEEGLRNTKEEIGLGKERKPLFEAAFKAKLKDGEVYARADILVPAGKEEWDIVEVKSSTKVKDENVHDVSFQRYVYEKAGLKIRKCYLIHINNEYVRKGEIDAKAIFTNEDITAKVADAIKGIEERIVGMLKIMSQKSPPKHKIAHSCTNPYECPFIPECWKEIPENSVFDLYRIGSDAFELYEKGIVSIKDIPEDYKLGEKQAIQKNCSLSGKECIDKDALKNFLKGLEYPLYFMDFETFATTIPLYDGLKPFQPVPFQFSLHVVDKKGKTKHHSFIEKGSGDPRKKFIEALKKVIKNKGSIIVYNQGFEQGVLKKLSEFMSQHERWVSQISKRLVDLLVPFRNFYYYNPKQLGSASLKAVLPAMTGKSYQNLGIKGGASASVLYFYATRGTKYGLKPSEKEVEKIMKDLEEYCGLDTEGMIWIVDRLNEIVK